MKGNSFRKTLTDLEGLIEKHEKAKERSKTARAKKKEADLREVRVDVHLEDHPLIKAIVSNLAAFTLTQRANQIDTIDDLKKVGDWIDRKRLHLELDLAKARVANLDLPEGEKSADQSEKVADDATDAGGQTSQVE